MTSQRSSCPNAFFVPGSASGIVTTRRRWKREARQPDCNDHDHDSDDNAHRAHRWVSGCATPRRGLSCGPTRLNQSDHRALARFEAFSALLSSSVSPLRVHAPRSLSVRWAGLNRVVGWAGRPLGATMRGPPQESRLGLLPRTRRGVQQQSTGFSFPSEGSSLGASGAFRCRVG